MPEPESQVAFPSAPYVYQVAKRMSPWCVMFTPQPDSLPAGARHHKPCTLTPGVEKTGGGGGGGGAGPAAAAPSITVAPHGPITYTLLALVFTAIAFALAGT